MQTQRRKTERKRTRENATPDLTPMIDVTFQLLIFFILCTRFRADERKFLVDLPTDEGPNSDRYPPKEKLTIYCVWNQELSANSFVVAIDARGRVPVEGSFTRLDEMVIISTDSGSAVAAKKARYKAVHANLVKTIENYGARSGANFEKFEISFAVDAAEGARSGTAPWLFVSLAMDATEAINNKRRDAKQDPIPLTFKFADALGKYSR
ncbi:MAG: biopolymer transporter ExbD [Planctomycetes bacterium]|nr:biopolymer transporter ExbD [Planctomycetota bacterium]MCA8934828.1 biopolymer transporter ExbD [Planctomycetota bacterium]